MPSSVGSPSEFNISQPQRLIAVVAVDPALLAERVAWEHLVEAAKQPDQLVGAVDIGHRVDVAGFGTNTAPTSRRRSSGSVVFQQSR